MTTTTSPRASAKARTAIGTALAAGAMTMSVAAGGGEYERAGWVARIAPGFHEVEGTATIVDDRTICVEHFTYDGEAPLVYFYLGAFDTYSAFRNGLQLEPQLDRRYDDEALTLTLPAGVTLDEYRAISVWCAEFNANFGSASFTCPADLDEDFQVTFTDILAVLSAWGACDGCPEDLDGNGVVDFLDILEVLRSWGVCGG